jgi:hydroxyacylglutathione hydrolase
MIPLEDNAGDIIGKAQRGLGISDSQLASRAGLGADSAGKIREGNFDDESLERVAVALGLNAAALRKLASGRWEPETIGEIDGLAMFNTTYGDMTVNAYLVWDPGTRDAVAFDTGADCSGMLERVQREQLKVKVILLTHAHPDHVADLRRLRQETSVPVSRSLRESGLKSARSRSKRD